MDLLLNRVDLLSHEIRSIGRVYEADAAVESMHN